MKPLCHHIPIEKIVSLLNDAFNLDPAAMHALVCNRIPCNRALADHPTIQIQGAFATQGIYHVGFLGILNGIAAIDGHLIDAMFEDVDDPPTERKRFLGFRLRPGGVAAIDDPDADSLARAVRHEKIDRIMDLLMGMQMTPEEAQRVADMAITRGRIQEPRDALTIVARVLREQGINDHDARSIAGAIVGALEKNRDAPIREQSVDEMDPLPPLDPKLAPWRKP